MAKPPARNNLRKLLSTGLLILSFVLTVVGAPLWYVSSVIDDEDAFVSLADDVAGHPVVRERVANEVTTITFDALASEAAVAEALPDQARALVVPITRLAIGQLTDVAFALLDTDVAIDARDSALREVHRQVTADTDEVVVDLRAVLVRTSREIGGSTVGAAVAKFVSDKDVGRFTLAEAGSSNSRLLAVVRLLPSVGGLVALAALMTFVASILVAPDRRRALVTGGLVIAAAAGMTTIVVSTMLFLVVGGLTSGDPIGSAAAEIVSADFAQQQRGTVLNGLVLAAIGMLFGNRPSAVALRRLPGDFWHRRVNTFDSVATVIVDNPPASRLLVWLIGAFTLLTWSRPTTRVVVSMVLLVAAALVFVWLATSCSVLAGRTRQAIGLGHWQPEMGHNSNARRRTNLAVLTAVVFLLWPNWRQPLVVAFLAIGAVAQAALDIPSAQRLARSGNGARSEDVAALAPMPTPGRRGRVLAAAAIVIALGVGLVSTFGSTARVEAADGCNGHTELCDRRIDEIVFAGSHNAMSSTDLGWDLAMQTGDIVTQLDYGIRALLIDALYWDNTGAVEGGDDTNAAFLIEAALSDDRPKPGSWLCHGFCALGASDLTAGLAEINLWLNANPREVLLIVVQDEISAADLTNAFDKSGLRTKAHVHTPETPFPTLSELIDMDSRVLVYAEKGGTPDEWLQHAWDAFTETPYTYGLPSEFSCAPNRGDADNPLFLINHWLTTGIPVREAAASVNRADNLLERVRACEAERGRLPTVLATDFVQTGDLLTVVDELNNVTE